METNNAQKVETSRRFSVPVEKLFQAWNDPEQLKKWWTPMGNHLQDVTNDLKEGGTVRYVFNNNTLVISGQYEQVKENESLVYTWNWDFPENALKNAAYKLHVQFSAQGEGSEIHIIQENVQQQENLHPNEEGWEKGLSDLEAFLSGQPQSGGQEQSNASNEVSGYQETPDQAKVGGA